MRVSDTRTGLKMARKHCVLDFIRELEHTVHIRLTLLAFLYNCCEFFVHSIFAAKKRVHFIFLDREACLDRLFASPILAVGLPLNENLANIGISVPTETNCLCTFCLLEAAQIEFEVFIVEINRCNSRVLRLKLLVRIKYCKMVNSDGVNPSKGR
jgi:hypothetical protein